MVNINDLKLDEIDYEIKRLNKELPHLELMNGIWELKKQLPKGVYFPDGIDEFDLPLIEKLSPDVSIYFNYKEKRKKEKELRSLGLILLSHGQVTYRLEDCRGKLYSLNNLRRKKLEPEDTPASTPQDTAKQDKFIPFLTPAGAKWNDLEMSFDEDNLDIVRVTVKEIKEVKNYAEMGFKNINTGLPNKLWKRLLEFKIGNIKYSGVEKEKVESDISRLRKSLKKYFKIKGNPINLKHGYESAFKVNVMEKSNRSVHSFSNYEEEKD